MAEFFQTSLNMYVWYETGKNKILILRIDFTRLILGGCYRRTMNFESLIRKFCANHGCAIYSGEPSVDEPDFISMGLVC